MKKTLIIWGNWGPYHYARFRAFHEQGRKEGLDVEGLELFPTSGYYDWKTSVDHTAVHHLNMGEKETDFNPWPLMTKLLPLLLKLKPDILFVPSYWHWSLLINYAGRACGAKVVMMNESHAATEQARGLKRSIKKTIVRNFHAGFVGGSPHHRHFSALGLPSDKIFRGYDAVDNDYFTTRSGEARENASALRERYRLPRHYFLNLGRMVKKKNLPLLVRAYAMLRERRPDLPHDLVLVGSGEEEPRLRELCSTLGLALADHRQLAATPVAAPQRELALAGGAGKAGTTASAPEPGEPTVYFYGFRQIEENPVFYALASAFILPSTTEEWGLVVNEAMASSLPVLVSERAGCAEDLVHPGRNGFTFDPEDPQALAIAMEKVSDPTVAERFGDESRRLIRHWGCERFATGAIKAAWTAAGESHAQSADR